MKRVLVFSIAYYPFVGGAEIAVGEISSRLSDFEFDLITENLNGTERSEERIGNVTVHRVGNGASAWQKALFPLRAYFKARKLHKAKRFDIAWAIMANWSAVAACIFSFFNRRVRYVLTLQEGDPPEEIKRRVRPFGFLFRLLFSRADKVQAISSFLASFGKEMGAKDVVVVPNGVDFGKFSAPAPAERLAEARELIGKKNGDVYLVTASRLVPKNGVGDIISALSYLPENVKLLVIGEGRLDAELKRQARESGNGSRVVFWGSLGHDDLPVYLKACDIFVRPSLSEGFGNSFIEAMAAGIPVIGTPVGGIPDFLADPESGKAPTGIFAKPNDPRSVAEAAERLMGDPDLVSNIVANALKLAKSHDWAAIADSMRSKVFLNGITP